MATTPTTDTDTITQEAPGAPEAPEGGFVELNLDGVAFSLEEAPPAEAAQPPAPTSAPAAVPAPSPAPPSPGRGDLRKALHEERGRNKAERAKATYWQQKAEELQRAQGRSEPIHLVGQVPQIGQAAIAKIREEAERSVGFGEPIAKVMELVDRKLQEVVGAVERGLRTQEILRMEQRFIRNGHPDYHATLQRAGIYHAVQINPATGQANDPRIARLVFEDDEQDPPEAAYLLAKALLGEAQGHAEAEEPGGFLTPAPLTPTSPPLAPAMPNPTNPPTPPPADAQAEAERRGARQTVERVIANDQKARGIRLLRPAGAPPKVELNEELRRQLDRRMDSDPDEVMAFFAKNPHVRRWWES